MWGRTRAKETLAATGISPDVRVKDLTDEQLITLRDYLEANYKIEGDLLVKSMQIFVARFRSTATKASVTVKGLPVRGQRTKTNARTRKGPEAHGRRKKKATK